MSASAHLNVFPLVSYSMLFGMDWLYIHRTKVDFYDKTIDFLDDDEEKRILLGNKNSTLVKMVIAIQEKHNSRKGCVLFSFHISSDKGKDVEDVEDLKRYLVLQQFQDVSPSDIS